MVAQRRYTDSGAAWLVVGASFTMAVVQCINGVSQAVFITEFIQHFKMSQSAVGILAAVRTSLMHLSGLACGALVARCGCRLVALGGALLCAVGSLVTAFINSTTLLLIFYGVVSGMAMGAITVPPEVIVQQYFIKRRPLAASIASMGYSTGGIIGAPVLRLATDHYGWRGAFILLAGISIQGLVAAMLLFPNPDLQQRQQQCLEHKVPVKQEVSTSAHAQEVGNSAHAQQDEQEARSKRKWLKLKSGTWGFFCNPLFLIFFLCAAPSCFGLNTYYSYGIQRAIAQGVQPLGASFVTSAIGVASLTGRFLSGFVANSSCSNRSVQFSVLILLAGVTVASSVWAGGSLALHLSFAAVYGLGLGGHHSLQVTVLVDILGVQALPRALGCLQVSFALGSFICIPLGGALYDATGGYTATYVVMGMTQAVAGCGLLVMAGLQRHKQQQVSNNRKAEEEEGGKLGGYVGQVRQQAEEQEVKALTE